MYQCALLFTYIYNHTACHMLAKVHPYSVERWKAMNMPTCKHLKQYT